jgi:single-stranded DNA-binding protein
MNVAIVQGRLSSDPRMTTLESGDVLVRYEVTVAQEGAPADSVPVAWLGAETQMPSDELGRGDEVVVVGRVRRRWYRPAAGPSRSTTEVVATTVVPASDRRRVRAALARAATTITA